MSTEKTYWGTGFQLRNGIGLSRVDEDGNQIVMAYHKWDNKDDSREQMVELMNTLLGFFIKKKAIGETGEIDVERDRMVLHELLREYLDSRVKG